MKLPPNKTKIVCTIGPASESPEVMEKMILAGMNVGRLNFSHGDFDGHKKAIDNLPYWPTFPVQKYELANWPRNQSNSNRTDHSP
jgi:hypothetical protein